ncbi:MAG: hypothetical protein KJO75_00100 [Dactylosporangium sp.]|nr:hypothetical protein [Dactylosporangium sp.]
MVIDINVLAAGSIPSVESVLNRISSVPEGVSTVFDQENTALQSRHVIDQHHSTEPVKLQACGAMIEAEVRWGRRIS